MQKKTIFVSTIAIATVMMVGQVSVVSAAPDEQRAERKEMRQENRVEVKKMLGEQKQEYGEFRKEFRNATPQERTTLRAEGKDIRKENVQERKEMRKENKDERMEMRKEGRMAATEKRAERFAARYSRVTTKLNNIIKRLSEVGIEVSAINAAVDTLDEKAAAVATAYTAYETAQSGDDKTVFTAARATLTAARDDFRRYYSGTLRPAIRTAVESVHTADDEA